LDLGVGVSVRGVVHVSTVFGVVGRVVAHVGQYERVRGEARLDYLENVEVEFR